MVLVSHLDDPVLATWQYGLGRVAAWTSDALGLWTKDWLAWNNAAHWWANVVTWTLPAANQGGLSVNGSITNTGAQLTVDLPAGTTAEGGQQQVQAHIINPDLSQQTVSLQPTAPDRWTGSFPTSQVGAYLLQVTWQGANKNASMLTTTTGLVVPYSPEYRTQGTDTNFLKLLATNGGGQLLDPSNSSDAFSQSLKPALASLPLAFWLLILAALLLPFDIALRRLASPEFLKEGFQQLRARILTLRGTASPATAGANGLAGTITSTPLSSVLQRRERIREQAKSTTVPKSTTSTSAPKLRVPGMPTSKAQRSGSEPSATNGKKRTPVTRPVQSRPATAPVTKSQSQPETQATTNTASKLVEAKRKRAQGKKP
jgi:hypothetical protein